jgi:hypothetical protein
MPLLAEARPKLMNNSSKLLAHVTNEEKKSRDLHALSALAAGRKSPEKHS